MAQSPDVYEPAATEPVSVAVVRALAEAMDRRPVDLDLQLYDAIDPDALDKLYDESGEKPAGPRVAFTLRSRRIVVDESRRVHVAPEPDGAATTDRPATPAGQTLGGAASPWRLEFGEF